MLDFGDFMVNNPDIPTKQYAEKYEEYVNNIPRYTFKARAEAMCDVASWMTEFRQEPATKDVHIETSNWGCITVTINTTLSFKELQDTMDSDKLEDVHVMSASLMPIEFYDGDRRDLSDKVNYITKQDPSYDLTDMKSTVIKEQLKVVA